MTKEQYEALSRPFRGRPLAVKGLKVANRCLTLSCYLLYPSQLLWALVTGDPRLLRLVLVPAVSFGVVSVFRRLRNSPRPYEALDIVPLIPRNKHGESFPSRHVFSVFLIAMTWGWICPPVGWLLGAVGVLLAFTRVVAGIHFPRDVVAGALLGILCGWVGFYLI